VDGAAAGPQLARSPPSTASRARRAAPIQEQLAGGWGGGGGEGKGKRGGGEGGGGLGVVDHASSIRRLTVGRRAPAATSSWRNTQLRDARARRRARADRAVGVCNAFATCCRRAACALGQLPVRGDVCHRSPLRARTDDLHAHVPRAPAFRTRTTAGRPSRLRAVPLRRRSIESTRRLWWSVRPRSGVSTVEVRICDAQPDLARRSRWRR
jgi:hypothetical protein